MEPWGRKQQGIVVGVLSAFVAGTACIGIANSQRLQADSDGPLLPRTPSETVLAASSEPPTPPVSTASPDLSAVPQEKLPAAEPTTVVVHVSGAVKRPGVYTLKPGNRVEDAIRLAGGFKENAVQDALNRADKVQDSDHLHILSRDELKTVMAASAAASAPRVAMTPTRARTNPTASSVVSPLGLASPTIPPGREVAQTEKPRTRGRVLGVPPLPAALPIARSAPIDSQHVTPNPVPGSDPASGIESDAASKREKFHNPGDGIVVLNTATAEELEQLPGVGPAMSARILEKRTELGGKFASLEQLMDVRGIGDKKYAKMLPFLKLD